MIRTETFVYDKNGYLLSYTARRHLRDTAIFDDSIRIQYRYTNRRKAVNAIQVYKNNFNGEFRFDTTDYFYNDLRQLQKKVIHSKKLAERVYSYEYDEGNQLTGIYDKFNRVLFRLRYYGIEPRNRDAVLDYLKMENVGLIVDTLSTIAYTIVDSVENRVRWVVEGKSFICSYFMDGHEMADRIRGTRLSGRHKIEAFVWTNKGDLSSYLSSIRKENGGLHSDHTVVVKGDKRLELNAWSVQTEIPLSDNVKKSEKYITGFKDDVHKLVDTFQYGTTNFSYQYNSYKKRRR